MKQADAIPTPPYATLSQSISPADLLGLFKHFRCDNAVKKRIIRELLRVSKMLRNLASRWGVKPVSPT